MQERNIKNCILPINMNSEQNKICKEMFNKLTEKEIIEVNEFLHQLFNFKLVTK